MRLLLLLRRGRCACRRVLCRRRCGWRSRMLHGRGLRMGWLLRLRDRRPGRRRRRLRGSRLLLRRSGLLRRLAGLLLVRRRLLLLLGEDHRAVLGGVGRDRLAQRKRRNNRTGKQKLLRSGHSGPSSRSLETPDLARRESTMGRQLSDLMMTK
jgi:hypothetical protein